MDHIPIDANEQEEKKSILKRSKEEINGKVRTKLGCAVICVFVAVSNSLFIWLAV